MDTSSIFSRAVQDQTILYSIIESSKNDIESMIFMNNYIDATVIREVISSNYKKYIVDTDFKSIWNEVEDILVMKFKKNLHKVFVYSHTSKAIEEMPYTDIITLTQNYSCIGRHIANAFTIKAVISNLNIDLFL